MATSVSANLDVNGLIMAMMKPYEARIATIDKKIFSYETDISSFSRLKSSFSALKESAHKIEVQITPLTAEEIKTTLEKFVKDYNGAVAVSNMSSDFSMRRFGDQFRKELDAAVYGKIGFSFDKSGVLQFNTAKFDALNTSDPTALTTAVKSLFDKVDATNSVLDKIGGTGGKIDYRTDVLEQRVNKLNKEKDRMTEQLATYEANFRKQFNNLQSILGQLDGSQNVITNWTAQMNKSNG